MFFTGYIYNNFLKNECPIFSELFELTVYQIVKCKPIPNTQYEGLRVELNAARFDSFKTFFAYFVIRTIKTHYWGLIS